MEKRGPLDGGSEGVEGLFFVNDVVVGKVEMSARGV